MALNQVEGWDYATTDQRRQEQMRSQIQVSDVYQEVMEQGLEDAEGCFRLGKDLQHQSKLIGLSKSFPGSATRFKPWESF